MIFKATSADGEQRIEVLASIATYIIRDGDAYQVIDGVQERISYPVALDKIKRHQETDPRTYNWDEPAAEVSRYWTPRRVAFVLALLLVAWLVLG